MKRFLGGFAAVALLVAFACAPRANADSTTLQLSLCNVASLCNAGSITLQTSGSGSSEVIEVSVSLTGDFVLFGNGAGNGAIGWNGTGLSGVDSISNGSLTLQAPNGSFSEFGDFQFSLAGLNGSHGISSLTFNITCTGGCTSVDQVTDFAVHVKSPSLGLTGFDATTGTPVTPTPEPSSLLLLGTGLLGLGAMVRRRLAA